MDEDDVDEDHLREYEAKLYAAIYHQPLSDILNDASVVNSFESTHLLTLQAAKRLRDCNSGNDDNESVVDMPNSAAFNDTIVISCDDTESSSITTLDDTDLNISSNLGNTRTKRCGISFSQADSCFESFNESLADKVSQFHSAQDIQEILPKNPEFWQILDEDTWEYQMMSKNRYYAKRSRGRCKNCNEEGHVQKNCTNERELVCFICGTVGHNGFRCRLKSCMLCFNTGHLTNNCKMSKVQILQMSCRRCCRNGHYDVNCPEQWRQFHFTACPDYELKRLKRKFKMKKSKKAFCYNCARKGHFGHECKESFFHDSRLLPLHPNVVKYDTVKNLNVHLSSRTATFKDVERSFSPNTLTYFDTFPRLESTQAKNAARFEKIKSRSKQKLAKLKVSNWPEERLRKERRKIKKLIRSARRRLEKANSSDQQNPSPASKFDLSRMQDTSDPAVAAATTFGKRKIDQNWKRALKLGLDKVRSRPQQCQVIEVPAPKRQRWTFDAQPGRSTYSWENEDHVSDHQQAGSSSQRSNTWFE